MTTFIFSRLDRQTKLNASEKEVLKILEKKEDKRIWSSELFVSLVKGPFSSLDTKKKIAVLDEMEKKEIIEHVKDVYQPTAKGYQLMEKISKKKGIK